MYLRHCPFEVRHTLPVLVHEYSGQRSNLKHARKSVCRYNPRRARSCETSEEEFECGARDYTDMERVNESMRIPLTEKREKERIHAHLVLDSQALTIIGFNVNFDKVNWYTVSRGVGLCSVFLKNRREYAAWLTPTTSNSRLAVHVRTNVVWMKATHSA